MSLPLDRLRPLDLDRPLPLEEDRCLDRDFLLDLPFDDLLCFTMILSLSFVEVQRCSEICTESKCDRPVRSQECKCRSHSDFTKAPTAPSLIGSRDDVRQLYLGRNNTMTPSKSPHVASSSVLLRLNNRCCCLLTKLWKDFLLENAIPWPSFPSPRKACIKIASNFTYKSSCL